MSNQTPVNVSSLFSDPMAAEAVSNRSALAKECGPPPDSQFDEDDPWIESKALSRLGQQIIDDFPSLVHIQRVNPIIRYAWKQKGGKHQGQETLGKCVKLSGSGKHFAGADFLIWVAADHIRELRVTQAWDGSHMASLLYHELKHIGFEIDEVEASPTYGEMKLRMVGHDAALFWDEVEYFGLWRKDLERTADAIMGAKQLRLVERSAD